MITPLFYIIIMFILLLYYYYIIIGAIFQRIYRNELNQLNNNGKIIIRLDPT